MRSKPFGSPRLRQIDAHIPSNVSQGLMNTRSLDGAVKWKLHIQKSACRTWSPALQGNTNPVLAWSVRGSSPYRYVPGRTYTYIWYNPYGRISKYDWLANFRIAVASITIIQYLAGLRISITIPIATPTRQSCQQKGFARILSSYLLEGVCTTWSIIKHAVIHNRAGLFYLLDLDVVLNPHRIHNNEHIKT